MFVSHRSTIKAVIFLMISISCIWVLFGPVQLGGGTAYVIISGNSMEPEFNKGDLIVTRRSTSYEIDSMVVYVHPQLGHVFHRIINQIDGNFILKGDNNYWIDTYQPGGEEILGEYWFFIPGGGNSIRALRDPFNFTLFVLVISTLIASIFFFKVDPRNKRSRLMTGKNHSSYTGNSRQELLLLLGIIAILALIFGGFAFAKPITQKVTDEIFYSHHSELSYTSSSPVGVYDRTGIKTGDPVYPSLSCKVDLDYQYQLLVPALPKESQVKLTGKILITAVLGDTDGWKRNFMLIPEYDFTGPNVSANLTIDICRLIEKIALKEELTGAENRAYILSILPEIAINGSIYSLAIDEVYQPEFMFDITDTVFRQSNSEEGFLQTEEGTLANFKITRNTMTVLGQELDVKTVRIIAGIVVGLCLLASVYPLWTLYKDWSESDTSQIQVQYHSLLVEVKKWTPVKKGTPIIDVADFNDLVRTAERCGAMILHSEDKNIHTYRVQEEGTLYQYILESPDHSEES